MPLVAGVMALWVLPAMAATRMDLDTDWQFRTDPQAVGEAQGWAAQTPAGTRPVTVPHTWNIGADHDFDGQGWYFKTLVLPPLAAGAHVELHFGATFYKSRVWVNGTPVGGHEGGHTAYWFDVSSLVRAGENRVVVELDNRPGFATIPGYAMRQAASGNVWYDWWRYGGIVRDVWLSVGDTGLIRRQRITSILAPDLAQVRAQVFVENVGGQPQDFHLTTVAFGPDGTVAAKAAATQRLEPGAKGTPALELAIPHPRLWNVGAAQLYRVATELRDGQGRLLDRREDSIGLRTVEIRDRHLLVNGQRVRLSGVTRHADSPAEGLAESAGTVRQDWNDLAALHTTLTRPVHYPQSQAVLDEADKDGILLVPEIPLWQFSQAQLRDPRVLALAQRMMREVVEELENHPSIFAWSVCNESDASTPGGQAYVARMKALINAIDPGRLVTFADADIAIKPWRDAAVMHDVDFIMANAYFGTWSGAAGEVEPWLDHLDRTYPDKMVIISEFGWPGPFSRDAQAADQARIANFQDQMAAFQKRDFVAGVIFWSYQDYKSSRNLWNGQVEGYVDHGLVDEYRQRKPSYLAWEQRNRPLTASAGWQVGKDGLDGFHALVRRAAPDALPSYPLVGYRARWIVADDTGAVLARGEQPLDGLDQGAAINARWQPKAGGAVLTLDVYTPGGVKAGGTTLDYAPLRLGSAHYPPDPTQLPKPEAKP
ncbi:glycoside hydrolase family 2 protein [Nitrospirillum sp. BR 11163]|uniref:glycoside hydrolase family 2 protein n=1 Tax=Nitrospirillum sp. BR 11163 TaxID=3104323 RepID=UPI002AFDDCFB|nr:glycoside hydrolase family 2 TIM barrel-domain containing protein [Nitrospirillum sp. BR 11163]MEA1673146.1 glycoside hydrolase family 2 TIM barrel-domain containing protein [Nitrospirillum sp. BR 11163]